jgi:Na+/H+ antiporter NhaD/arsenite permease-like protein
VAGQLDQPRRFLALLMLATAGLSAFLNHDIVCFVFTPIVAAALLQRRINPVPFLIALAIASNIGAAATLVGNPQGMLIAQVAGLGFGPYLLWCLAPVMFALVAAWALIGVLSRHQLAALPATVPGPAALAARQPLDRAHAAKGLVILALVVALLVTSLPKELVALTAAAVHLASPKFSTQALLRLVDWPILVLFMGLFVVTGAFQATGFGDTVVQTLAHAGLDLQVPAVLALATTVLSNLVNNAAAVMLLLKVPGVTALPDAYVLALANSFGGSLLITGSVSNIIVVQQARSLGITIGFRDYARLGIPVTLAALCGLLGWVVVAG